MKHLNLTNILGVLLIAGSLVAGNRAWIKHDTVAQLVSLGLYAIARRKTEAAKIDLLKAICRNVSQPATAAPLPPSRFQRTWKS